MTPPRLRACAEDSSLLAEVRCPVNRDGAGEAKVGTKRVPHRVHETVDGAQVEAVFPPDVQNTYAAFGALDPWFHPTNEAVAEEDRQHVPAPARLGRRLQELRLVAEHEALPAYAFDRDRNELAVFDQLLSQRGPPGVVGSLRVRLCRAEAAEDVSAAADAQETVCAIA